MKTTQANDTHCAECSAQFPVHPAGYSGGTGYAIRPDGSRICYGCADKAEREELRDRSKPFCAYLSGDKVTTWTGGTLMRVTDSRPCRLTRASNWHDASSYRSIHAVDVHGGHWSGRGSDGVAIRLRPVKA